MNRRALFAALLGALLLGAYWWSVRPPLPQRPYLEDMCNHDMARQMMSENLALGGGPRFVSDKVMAPRGMSLPFYAGWNVERDWVGAYVWGWDRDFPFYWVYYGLSLLACYLAAGFVFGRMGLGALAAWGLALAMVVFNLPRHSKLWNHSDNVMLHWVYAGFLLDAWIWQRFVREGRWCLHLELWRGATLAGVLFTMGYMWGPSVMVWEVTRACMVILALLARGTGRFRIDLQPRQCILPLALGGLLAAIDLRWFLPLFSEVRSIEITQGAGYLVSPDQTLRPLFLELLLTLFGGRLPLAPYDEPETVVAAGWAYWIPFTLVIILLARRGRQHLWIIAPFALSTLLAVLYFTPGLAVLTIPLTFVDPFLRFFRTACRFAIFLPPLMAITIALAVPDLPLRPNSPPRLHRAALALGLALFLIGILEASLLFRPTRAFAPLPAEAARFFDTIRALPGDTVLTLPFCVAGANGVCTAEQCAGYPAATLGHCTRLFHDKKVYGSYTSRMTEADCDTYRVPPFVGWHKAWREGRCFDESEWRGLCDHLATHPEIASILVLPDVWKSAGEAACEAELSRRLGPALDEIVLPVGPTAGGTGGAPQRLRRYGARCE